MTFAELINAVDGPDLRIGAGEDDEITITLADEVDGPALLVFDPENGGGTQWVTCDGYDTTRPERWADAAEALAAHLQAVKS